MVVLLSTMLVAASCAGSSKSNAPKKLSEIADEYKTTIRMIYQGEITFDGGDGLSMQSAVVINGTEMGQYGSKAQFIWVGLQQGHRGIDWQLRSQQIEQEGEKLYASMVIQDFIRGRDRTYWFDISEFYGK